MTLPCPPISISRPPAPFPCHASHFHSCANRSLTGRNEPVRRIAGRLATAPQRRRSRPRSRALASAHVARGCAYRGLDRVFQKVFGACRRRGRRFILCGVGGRRCSDEGVGFEGWRRHLAGFRVQGSRGGGNGGAVAPYPPAHFRQVR